MALGTGFEYGFRVRVLGFESFAATEGRSALRGLGVGNGLRVRVSGTGFRNGFSGTGGEELVTWREQMDSETSRVQGFHFLVSRFGYFGVRVSGTGFGYGFRVRVSGTGFGYGFSGTGFGYGFQEWVFGYGGGGARNLERADGLDDVSSAGLPVSSFRFQIFQVSGTGFEIRVRVSGIGSGT